MRRFWYLACAFMTYKSCPDIWMRSIYGICCSEYVQKASVCAY